MRDSEVCSHCGRPLAPKLAVSGPVRQRIVEVIAQHPDGIARENLIRLAYASDPNGGPCNPNTVSVLVHHANRELRPQGYEITSGRGRGSRYRLVQIKPVRTRRRYLHFQHWAW